MSKVMPLKSRRVRVMDSPEAVNDLACEQGWSDGLPIVPPTAERVRRMLDRMPRDSVEVVANVPPACGEATVEKIAINAVMAGCLPEYMPVVVAAVEAMCEPEFNLLVIQGTTNPAGPLLIINGPLRKQLNVNCDYGCLGPGCRANATIGRAIRLILINIGGALIGTVDKATHGMPGKYTFCFGEDEESSVWEPLHVERGFPKDTSTVTVVGVQSSINVNTAGTSSGKAFLRLTADALSLASSNNMRLQSGEPVVILSPVHASLLQKEGFSKSDIKKFIFDRAWITLDELSDARSVGHEPRVVNGKVYTCEKPEDILVVVAGGAEAYHLAVLPNFGYTRSVTKAVNY